MSNISYTYCKASRFCGFFFGDFGSQSVCSQSVFILLLFNECTIYKNVKIKPTQTIIILKFPTYQKPQFAIIKTECQKWTIGESVNYRNYIYCIWICLLTAKRVGLHEDFFKCLICDMWCPKLRWILQHSSQINKPRFTNAQAGSEKKNSNNRKRFKLWCQTTFYFIKQVITLMWNDIVIEISSKMFAASNFITSALAYIQILSILGKWAHVIFRGYWSVPQNLRFFSRFS